jgi:hypothetical protein
MIAKLRGKLDAVRQQVVIDRHLAAYPNIQANAAGNEENAENFG